MRQLHKLLSILALLVAPLAAQALLPCLSTSDIMAIRSAQRRWTNENTSSGCTLPSTGLDLDLYAGSLSSSPFSSWPDISGTSNTTVFANSPTWANNTFGTGLAGATFVSSSNQYGMMTTTIGAAVPIIQVYGVIKWTSGQGGLVSGTSSGQVAVDVNSSGNIRILKAGFTSLAASTASLTSGVATEFAALYRSDTGAWAFYINGTLDSSGTNSTLVTSNSVKFVADDNIDDTFFTGSIYEIAVYATTSGADPGYQSSVHSCWVSRGLP